MILSAHIKAFAHRSSMLVVIVDFEVPLKEAYSAGYRVTTFFRAFPTAELREFLNRSVSHFI